MKLDTREVHQLSTPVPQSLQAVPGVGTLLTTLYAWDRRHPLPYDILVTAAVALLGLMAAADGTFDATITSRVPEAPSALPWLVYVGFTVPVLWRRSRPLVALGMLVVVVGVMVWWGLDHTSALSLPIVVYSAALRVPLSRLAWACGVLLAEVVFSALRWQTEAATEYLGLLVFVAGGALLGITVRTRREYLASLRERAAQLEVERDQRAQLAVAAERARIAREMHDIVAHNLAVMVALADGAVFSMSDSPRRAEEMIGKVSLSGREALGEMRRLVGVLRGGEPSDPTSAVSPQPGLDDIDALVDQVRAAGLEVVLSRSGEPGAWGPGVGLAVYRIVQEALTNTMKHAGPHARAEVRLGCSDGGIDLEVIDDGGRPGAHPTEDGTGGVAGDGHGLTGMIERAASYGGHVEAGPRPSPGGWRVHVRLRTDDGRAL